MLVTIWKTQRSYFSASLLGRQGLARACFNPIYLTSLHITLGWPRPSLWMRVLLELLLIYAWSHEAQSRPTP